MLKLESEIFPLSKLVATRCQLKGKSESRKVGIRTVGGKRGMSKRTGTLVDLHTRERLQEYEGLNRNRNLTKEAVKKTSKMRMKSYQDGREVLLYDA